MRTAVVAFASTSSFDKKMKTVILSATDEMVEAQLYKLRGTLDLCFMFDMVFVKYSWLLIPCSTIFTRGRSRVFSNLGTAKKDVFLPPSV